MTIIVNELWNSNATKLPDGGPGAWQQQTTYGPGTTTEMAQSIAYALWRRRIRGRDTEFDMGNWTVAGSILLGTTI